MGSECMYPRKVVHRLVHGDGSRQHLVWLTCGGNCKLFHIVPSTIARGDGLLTLMVTNWHTEGKSRFLCRGGNTEFATMRIGDFRRDIEAKSQSVLARPGIAAERP